MSIEKERMNELVKEIDNIFSQYSSEDIKKISAYFTREIERKKKVIEARKNSEEYKRLKASEK